MSLIGRLMLVLILAWVAVPLAAIQAEEAESSSAPVGPEDDGRPIRAIRRAVIVSVDGLRPDLLLRAQTPNMRRLIENGSFTFWARTVPQSITLPSHTSMLTGVTPDKHEVLWNDDRPHAGYPKYPTLFRIAKKAGLTTGIAAGKTKFVTLAEPGTVDWASIEAFADDQVARRAVGIIARHSPDLMFVHFPGADKAGHAKGWGTPDQIAAIEKIDAQLGKILDLLDARKLSDSTVVLLSADHGGMGVGHGGEDPRSRHIPWIVCGPGIRRNRDLTGDAMVHVNTEDTFATICYLLNLPRGDGIDGKPIRQIVERKQTELLHAIDDSAR